MDEKLENLIKKIYKIIDTYYDEREAEEIAEIIEDYIKDRGA